MQPIIKAQNLSKQYRLGEIGTGTLRHDFKRWAYRLRGKEDPFLKIGETNDRSNKGESDYVWALKDINFEIMPGDVVGIVGKNGAGKSTLLKILSKITGPSAGRIDYNGRIGSLLEVGTGFHPELTGRDNIFLNGAILGMTKAEIRSKLDEIIDFSGCERYIDTPVKRYSSGMMVRLGFAVAAHLEPEILVVDEVLAVGDAEFQQKAIGKMKDVSNEKGRTVLFVSHNMNSMKQLCKKGIWLSKGRNVFSGSINDTINAYLNETNDTDDNGIIGESFESHSSIIKPHKITINDSTSANITLNYPNRHLELCIEGTAVSDTVGEVEVLFFDANETLLAKYAPHLKDGYFHKIKAGNFKVNRTIALPDNICNGEFWVQIDLTHPGVEYLVRFPKAAKLLTGNYIGESGFSFDYNNSGFIIL